MVEAYEDEFREKYKTRLSYNILEKETYYLSEAGLIQYENKDGEYFAASTLRITTKGIDYIFPEDSITDELNYITVKFDKNSILEIIESGLLNSNISAEQRTSVLQKLTSLSGDTLKAALQEFVKIGVQAAVKTGVPF